nr:hypothetical protein GCM10020093_095390 [Planobispora longispora]
MDGVGEEAFGYELTALDRAHSVIRFRSSNLLVEVNLSMTGKRATADLRRRALRTAQVVARGLDGRG